MYDLSKTIQDLSLTVLGQHVNLLGKVRVERLQALHYSYSNEMRHVNRVCQVCDDDNDDIQGAGGIVHEYIHDLYT